MAAPNDHSMPRALLSLGRGLAPAHKIEARRLDGALQGCDRCFVRGVGFSFRESDGTCVQVHLHTLACGHSMGAVAHEVGQPVDSADRLAFVVWVLRADPLLGSRSSPLPRSDRPRSRSGAPPHATPPRRALTPRRRSPTAPRRGAPGRRSAPGADRPGARRSPAAAPAPLQ